MRTAIDTNILSAIWSGEPTTPVILRQVKEAKNAGALLVAPVVYCELLAYPNASEAFVDRFLEDTAITVDYLLTQAVWLEAGRRFSSYARRRRSISGQPKRLLADFLIGAHALLRADRLITLDPAHYKHDFTELTLITS